MKKLIIILLMVLVPVSYAGSDQLNATSYWGYVTVDGLTKAHAQIAVTDSSGNELAGIISTNESLYQVNVPWDNTSTTIKEGVVDGEIITFTVDGMKAISKKVDARGTNNRLDLAVATSPSVTLSPVPTEATSGAAGGGISSEPSENILKKESRMGPLAKDVPKTFTFVTPELAVSEITITSNVNTEPINVQIELLGNLSAMVTNEAPGVIYKYLNIWVGPSGFAVPQNIKEAVIKFRLEKSWISSAGIDETGVAMQRWDGTEWISLATQQKDSDENYLYYEAATDSFSQFAITGGELEVAPTGSAQATPSITQMADTPAPTPTKKAQGFGIILAITGLIAVILSKRSK